MIRILAGHGCFYHTRKRWKEGHFNNLEVEEAIIIWENFVFGLLMLSKTWVKKFAGHERTARNQQQWGAANLRFSYVRVNELLIKCIIIFAKLFRIKWRGITHLKILKSLRHWIYLKSKNKNIDSYICVSIF